MTVIVLDTDIDSVVLAADQQWTDDTDLVFYQTKIQSLVDSKSKCIGAIATAGDGKKGVFFESLVLQAFAQTSGPKDPLLVLRRVCDVLEPKLIPDSLVVANGQGYHIDESGLVLPKNRWAIGSGGMVALGAMWSRKGTAERLARLGCSAAIELTSGCSGPVDVFCMDRTKDT